MLVTVVVAVVAVTALAVAVAVLTVVAVVEEEATVMDKIIKQAEVLAAQLTLAVAVAAVEEHGVDLTMAVAVEVPE